MFVIIDETHTRSQSGGRDLTPCRCGSGVFLAETPAESQNTCQQNYSPQGNEASVERRQLIGLAEVDETIENCYDIVDAKDERIQDTCADEFETKMEIVELGEGEEEE
jgi:GTP cyclohydrolase III